MAKIKTGDPNMLPYICDAKHACYAIVKKTDGSMGVGPNDSIFGGRSNNCIVMRRIVKMKERGAEWRVKEVIPRTVERRTTLATLVVIAEAGQASGLTYQTSLVMWLLMSKEQTVRLLMLMGWMNPLE
jgi:hypothetical protein